MSRARARLGAFFLGAGAMHFIRPKWYQAIVPDYLPAHRELVAASGAAEIAGAVGVLHDRTVRPAGWWLIATLIAVFPANVHMALHPDRYGRFSPTALYLRLPVQLVFIWWVWRAALAER